MNIAKIFLIVLEVCILTSGLSVAARESRAAAPGCADLLNNKCTECHYLSRVCEAIGQKSRWQWKTTIKLMAKKGAKISDDEVEPIRDCLVAPAEEVTRLCARQ